jgi:hypothetical protein
LNRFGCCHAATLPQFSTAVTLEKVVGKKAIDATRISAEIATVSMKVKKIFCLLILFAVSLAQMSAQTVLQIPPGLSTIANPCYYASPDDDRVALLFPQMPIGTTLYKFDALTQRFSANRFSKHGWENPAETLYPGEGAFIFNPSYRQITVSFSGAIGVMGATIEIPAGLALVGNSGFGCYFECAFPLSEPMWPGELAIGNYFNPQDGDVVYTFNHKCPRFDAHHFGDIVYMFNREHHLFDAHHFVAGQGWDSPPVVGIGESFFVFIKQPRTIQTTWLLVPGSDDNGPSLVFSSPLP